MPTLKDETIRDHEGDGSDITKTPHQLLLKMLRITQDNQVMLVNLVKEILNKQK